jgi:hypothetical protein
MMDAKLRADLAVIGTNPENSSASINGVGRRAQPDERAGELSRLE